MAMLPLEPGRFSTTTAWPTSCEILCPTTRAEISGAPPGGMGTISLIGRVGYWAHEWAEIAAAKAKTTKRLAEPFLIETPPTNRPSTYDAMIFAVRQKSYVHDMFIERRIERLIAKLRESASIPLRLELWNGRTFDLASQPTVKIGVTSPSALRFLSSPNLMKLGYAYVEGYLRVEGPILEVFRAAEALARGAASRGSRGLRRFWLHNRKGDRDAIQYHYDVSNDFYSLWLDRNMVYSCAYFRAESDSLDLAQEQKLDHILDKLMVEPGERFLDIGCGWGALILRAAKKVGARATGVTVSPNQHDFVSTRIC